MFNLFKKINKNKKNRGFALLFTVVIVSSISVVIAGLTSALYKQSILSSLAKDSQSSFYQADTGYECALYADLKEISFTGSTFLEDHAFNPWYCGGLNLVATKMDEIGVGSYTLTPLFEDEKDKEILPCFRIYVTKEDGETSIKSRGYNICDLDNGRTVEREIEVKYRFYSGE